MQTPEFLLFSAKDLERLIEGEPRPCHGLTFCAGCFTLAGDTLLDWLDRFGLARDGYTGWLCPERVPRLPGDPFEELSTAWALGCLRAILR
jgi:hypothetical protein